MTTTEIADLVRSVAVVVVVVEVVHEVQLVREARAACARGGPNDAWRREAAPGERVTASHRVMDGEALLGGISWTRLLRLLRSQDGFKNT